jgi:S-methylmethionine-dependent homocysteine/selenocysteine methylase/SAM-dependent methyltransferase
MSGIGVGPFWPYEHVQAKLASGECVVLDGGVGTELAGDDPAHASPNEALWGTEALLDAPDRVLRVHRRYVALGCDVITTDTWGLASALAPDGPRLWQSTQPVHWMDVARRGVRLAREAVAAEGRSPECAVAFSLNGALAAPEGEETVGLLSRVLADEPPDLLLLETLSLVDPLYAIVEPLVATGLPLWLSFRRCRHGLCGVFGQHWGGPEGDAFGRAARRLEDMGVAALLVNCIPPDHVDGMVSYLRDFTDLPLGVYPNLGYYTSQGWRFDPGVDGAQYAKLAQRWRAEGAQIIGGCCGVGPEHIAAARAALRDGPRDAPMGGGGAVRTPRPNDDPAVTATGTAVVAPWLDDRDRPLYPIAFPEIQVDPGVFAPSESSLLVWRYLFEERVGEARRCLDVGCGAGLQAVQLALNGAGHVHAIDIAPAAVESTKVNAFRNGVADRVTGAVVDLYPWVPEERYDVIVASLYQTPVDPMQQLTTHRPLDYWGRNQLDHLIEKLPMALERDGAAYLMQLSILSQRRTAELLARNGLAAEVVDFSPLFMSEHFLDALPQVRKVEAQSDAYHLEVGGQPTMVAYLLKVTFR